MKASRRAEIDAAFDAALDQPHGERTRWLREHFAADRSIVAEVEALLAAHERAEGILEAMPVQRPAGPAATDTIPHRRIGAYRVLREIGRGGMGVVYLAERDDGQFRRRVAIKLLRASPDGEELHRRFIAERQILASLDHPNIAQLQDGGVTDGQLPYLVMEYVEGLPITVYCDRHRLALDDRLSLFTDVCAAVRHAHQNLVVHRDLKPGNILVTGDGRVKLLDFGIAKLLNPGISAVAQPVTRTEFRVMTPEYASPEQVRGEPLSTASDVYSLGVVLYELLAGRRPYRITTGSPAELATVICEREPERPSSRIAQSAADGDEPPTADPAAVATSRNSTPQRLRRELQGDLDAIVMMALRKEPRRRYGTAERLARDIERYLDGRPVLAHRGSQAYRLRRFVARHRGSATAAALVVASLVAGSGVALWQAAAARNERDRAEAALRESEDVTAFLVGLFQATDPLDPGGAFINVRDLMRRAAGHADELGQQPRVQARMFEVMGRVHLNLADYAGAERLLRRALAIQRSLHDSTHPDVTATFLPLSESIRRQGRYLEAESLTTQGVQLRQLASGDHLPDAADFLFELSGLAVRRADLTGADSIASLALELRRTERGPDDPLVARALERASATRRRLGRVAETEQLLRDALAIYSRHEPSGTAASYTRLRLADVISQDRGGDRDEADTLYRRAIADLEAGVGPGHQRTFAARNDYAGFLMRLGRAREAEPIFRQNMEFIRRAYGDDHPITVAQLGLIASAAAALGRFAESDSIVRIELAGYERLYGRPSNAYIGALGYLARTLVRTGRIGDADSVGRLAVSLWRDSLGETDSPLLALAIAGWAGTKTAGGSYTDAESLYGEALRMLLAHTGEDHRDVRRIHSGLANLYDRWGRPADAARHRTLAGPDIQLY
jgi:eukaryotic-like serine/threonine-protein kinase